jgi:hypothetical protein
VLIYVWALEQEDDSKRKFKEQDVLVPWCIPPTKEDKQAGKGSPSTLLVRACRVVSCRRSLVSCVMCYAYG